MESILGSLYGVNIGQKTFQKLQKLLSDYGEQLSRPEKDELDEHDAMLITYADQVQRSKEKPLDTLAKFSSQYLKDTISSIHILPFFPYSSDDGFSVSDYKAVNPNFGNWNSIEKLNSSFRLMFDAVINHSSVKHQWFQSFLQGEEKYEGYYIVVPEGADLSRVVRPRALPLLLPVEVKGKKLLVWTTFSADQADLNYSNPELLLEIIEVLLTYIARGAEFIRLDAIAYLWKEIGTSCIHLPQTHAVIRLFRQIFDEVSPHVKIITETNVPHQDNISYFGDGENEAQLVYNFSLPPLTLHTFHTGQADVLSNWAASLSLPTDRVTFFNFLASHDGIGLNPARGILSEDDVLAIADQALAHQGLVSYKTNRDGTKSPYEININYFDALSPPDSQEPLSQQIARFICSQAIMLAFRGLPGIYFHSLFGSRGWLEGVKMTGHNRTINRQKLDVIQLEQELANQDSLRSQVFKHYGMLLKARSSSPAFNPFGRQEVMDFGNKIFTLKRTSVDGRYKTCCLHNISDSPQSIKTPAGRSLFDRKKRYHENESLTLQAYQVEWLDMES